MLWTQRLLTTCRAAALFPIFAVLFGWAMADAGELRQPVGDVVLRITGAIANANSGDAAVFDMKMLGEMPPTAFTTSTIWTDGETSFVGVELDDLLNAVGASGSRIIAVALNDYAVKLPVSDARNGGPIVAYLMNGEPMSPRTKGPLWIVYPYDSATEYRSELIYSRSIWQLASMRIE